MGRSVRARIGVKAPILRGRRVLLLRGSARSPQHPNFWDLPGGGVKEGETLERALRREVMEETGLSARVGRPYHAALLSWLLEDGTRVPSVGITFVCRIRKGVSLRFTAAEHSLFVWVARRDLRKYRLSRLCGEVVRLAFRRFERGGIRQRLGGFVSTALYA